MLYNSNLLGKAVMHTGPASGRLYLAPDFGNSGVQCRLLLILPGDFRLWVKPTGLGIHECHYINSEGTVGIIGVVLTFKE
jgi:hypothetical protein